MNEESDAVASIVPLRVLNNLYSSVITVRHNNIIIVYCAQSCCGSIKFHFHKQLTIHNSLPSSHPISC